MPIRLIGYGNKALKKIIISELNITYWFSYETIVAYRYGGIMHISQNVWSNTTGRHLSIIRIENGVTSFEDMDHEAFTEKLELIYGLMEGRN